MNKVAQDNFLFCATASALLCFSICDKNLEADFHLLSLVEDQVDVLYRLLLQNWSSLLMEKKNHIFLGVLMTRDGSDWNLWLSYI